MSKSKAYYLGDIDPEEVFPGFEGRFIHSDTMSFAYWEINKGSVLEERKLPHEQVISMVSGRMQFSLDGEDIDFHEGMVLVISPNVKYSGKAISKCKLLDVTHPVRKDLKNGKG